MSKETRDRLAKLSEATGRPMAQLVEQAADALERRIFFRELDDRYEELRSEPDAWHEIERERAEESSALRDHSS